MAGTVLGLAAALGALLNKGSERFNLGQFFNVTGVLIIDRRPTIGSTATAAPM